MDEIVFCSHEDELYRRAAAIITDFIKKELVYKEYVVFGISGGRSVSGIYKLLKDKQALQWDRIHLFMADERLVPPDDAGSNFKLAKDEFIDELVKKGYLPEENIHPFIPDTSSKDGGIADYEAELKRCGGVYDIILLSAGEDGHIASLFPHHHSINNESNCYIIMNDSPKPPPGRMSISQKLLQNSECAVLLFVSESKKQAYTDFMDNTIDYKSCPAKLVAPLYESYVLTTIK